MRSRTRLRLPKVTGDPPQLSLPFPGGDVGRRDGPGRATCLHCGRKFVAPAWYVREGLRVVFCGQECRRTWEDGREEMVLRLDGRPDRRGGDWEVRAGQARSRDGYTCRGCGINEEALGRQLDVHHVVPFRLLRPTADVNRLDNLISVCPVCHARMEAQGIEALPLFGQIRRSGAGRIPLQDEREG